MKDWQEIAGRPARIVRSYSQPSTTNIGATRGRRVTRPGDGETWATYTPRRAAKPKSRLLVAANDNKPTVRSAVSIPLPEHREAAQPTPAEPPTPMRIRLNLQKTAPDEYRTLVRVEELLRPADLLECDIRPSAGNDNTGFGMDFRHEVSPSNETFEDDLLSAYADGMRSRVVVHRNGAVEHFDGGLKFQCERDGSNEILEVGGRSSRGRRFGMRFYRGALAEYVKDGKRLRPAYQQKDPRGPDGMEWTPRASTASQPRPQALAEIDRALSADALAAELGHDAMALLRLVLEADSFAEIGTAYGYAASAAHRHGRRISIDVLRAAEKIAA